MNHGLTTNKTKQIMVLLAMQPQINHSLVSSINNLQRSVQIIFFVVINTDLSEQQPLKWLKMHWINQQGNNDWLINTAVKIHSVIQNKQCTLHNITNACKGTKGLVNAVVTLTTAFTCWCFIAVKLLNFLLCDFWMLETVNSIRQLY